MKATETAMLHRSMHGSINLLLSCLVCLGMIGTQPVSAAPPSLHYYVDNFSDVRVNSGCQDGVSDNDCDLRGAIDLANAGSGSYYHHIHVPAGTFTLTTPGSENLNATGDLDVYVNTTIIEGAGMNDTIITQVGTSDRIFDHFGDDGLKLIGLTVSGGRVVTGAGGAGIRSITTGPLTLTNVRVTDNRATGTADTDIGGGVLIYNTSAMISGSIISVNRAEHGAGLAIHNSYDGPVTTIVSSSIHDNLTNGGHGGGILALDDSRMELENVTIAGNLADGDGWGGGIYIYGNLAAHLNHVTVANNWASYMGDAIAGDYLVHLDIDNSILYYDSGNDVCYYSPVTTLYIASNGHNINNQTNQNWCHFGPVPGPDPLLGTLGFHGSTTEVIPLLAGSPAIDAGNPLDSVDFDQRGKRRQVDGDGDGTIEPDAGAYEVCEEFFLPLIDKP